MARLAAPSTRTKHLSLSLDWRTTFKLRYHSWNDYSSRSTFSFGPPLLSVTTPPTSFSSKSTTSVMNEFSGVIYSIQLTWCTKISAPFLVMPELLVPSIMLVTYYMTVPAQQPPDLIAVRCYSYSLNILTEANSYSSWQATGWIHALFSDSIC